PSHFGRDAPTIDRMSLDYFLGPCQVIRVAVPRRSAIKPEMVIPQLTAERVLLATGTYPDAERFNEDFAALSPELVHSLHKRGVKLIGIDTPSVDLFDSENYPAHHACVQCGMAVLEGLVLSQVPEGVYELIALPLRLVGFEASPVRAVLRTYEKR